MGNETRSPNQQSGISHNKHQVRSNHIRYPTHAHSLCLKNSCPCPITLGVWFITMTANLLNNLQFGVLEIGSFIGMFLFGVVFLQTFNYYNMYPDDGWVNKTLVRSTNYITCLAAALIKYSFRWPQFCVSRYSKPCLAATELGSLFFRICETTQTMGINYQIYRTTIIYYGKIGMLGKSTAVVTVTIFGGIITLLVQVMKNYIYPPVHH